MLWNQVEDEASDLARIEAKARAKREAKAAVKAGLWLARGGCHLHGSERLGSHIVWLKTWTCCRKWIICHMWGTYVGIT